MKLQFGEEVQKMAMPKDRRSFATKLYDSVTDYFSKMIPGLNTKDAQAARTFFREHNDHGLLHRAWDALMARPSGDAMIDGVIRGLVSERAAQVSSRKIKVETQFTDHGVNAVAKVPLNRAMEFTSIFGKDDSQKQFFADEIEKRLSEAMRTGEDPKNVTVPVTFSTQWRKVEDKQRDTQGVQTVFRVGIAGAGSVAVSGTQKLDLSNRDIKKELKGKQRDLEVACLMDGCRKMGTSALSAAFAKGKKARSVARIKAVVMNGAVGASMALGALSLAGAAVHYANAANVALTGSNFSWITAERAAETGAALGLKGIGIALGGAKAASIVLPKLKISQFFEKMFSGNKDEASLAVINDVHSEEKRAAILKTRDAASMSM